MKQVLQSLKTGVTDIVDVPSPQVKAGYLLIRSLVTVVSAGTEKMLVDFGKSNLINKARQQPDKVKEVLQKVKTEGIIPTIDAIRTKLDQPLALGYSNAGVVIGLGAGVEGYKIGDRVVSNGHHAEIVSVPKNLCAKIPNDVDNESAAFTVIGSIGLQGLRLAAPSLGEYFVVTGLGLIGLITVQLLIAHGCRVLGIDMNPDRVSLARKYGADVVDLSRGEDPIKAAMIFSGGRGVDGVLITASTKSSAPIHQAAQMCRKRGRIILVGVTGLELSRSDFYEKELSFQVSCSYGPGRYDPSYEENGQDYPLGFVRWTEQRNFEAVLDMIVTRRIDMKSLISHRFPIDQANEAYKILGEGGTSLGIVIDYSTSNDALDRQKSINLNTTRSANIPPTSGPISVGMIGAGNFANQVLLPAIKKTGVHLVNIASSGGIHGVHVGRRYGFQKTTTDSSEIITDPKINTVFITTRHNSHAMYVKEAIQAGKHIFVEKPLCISRHELIEIESEALQEEQILTVGFNRRFAPHTIKMKELLSSVLEPKMMIMTVNAGMIPSDHWTQDPKLGGGRIIGEACHFVDLLRFLAGHPIIDVQSTMIGTYPGMDIRQDKMTITLSFADGSIGTIHYFANGHKSFPKERLEIFCGGRILSLDNFRVLTGYGWPGFKKMKLWNQDKGHSNCVRAFVHAIEQKTEPPIPLQEIYEVTRVTFDVLDKAHRQGGV